MQTKDAHTNSTPLDISTEISPMTGISEKRVKVIVRTSRNSRKIGQHRITKTTRYQLCPNQRSQVTKMRYQEGAEDSPTATSAPHPSALRRSSETWRLLRQWSKRKSKPSASGVRAASLRWCRERTLRSARVAHATKTSSRPTDTLARRRASLRVSHLSTP